LAISISSIRSVVAVLLTALLAPRILLVWLTLLLLAWLLLSAALLLAWFLLTRAALVLLALVWRLRIA
jgi:hypothetical protein